MCNIYSQIYQADLVILALIKNIFMSSSFRACFRVLSNILQALLGLLLPLLSISLSPYFAPSLLISLCARKIAFNQLLTRQIEV